LLRCNHTERVRYAETAHYSVVIEWGDEDELYVVTLAGWEAAGYHGHIHGNTYAEAVAAGQEFLASWLDYIQQEGEPAPAPPRTFASASALHFEARKPRYSSLPATMGGVGAWPRP
jgi:predicted RNase H-like HicB family nuclease